MAFHSVEELRRWKVDAAPRPVRVTRVNAFRYVYGRSYARQKQTGLVERYYALLAWLAARGTDVRDVVIIGMSLDDPAITPAENSRYDLGVAFAREPGGLIEHIVRSRPRSTGLAGARPARTATLPLPTRSECEAAGLTLRDFGAHDVATLHAIGDLGHVGCAWEYLCRIWLPTHAIEPADRPAMELFVRLPEEIGWQTFDLHACIPVARR